MPKLCFERHEMFEGVHKSKCLVTEAQLKLKSCILKALNVRFGKLILVFRYPSLFHDCICLSNTTGPSSQRIVFFFT